MDAGRQQRRGGLAPCGEIDIMELAGEKFSDEFHVFSIIWKEDLVGWYVDEERYHAVTPADMAGQPYPFNHSFFFVFNLAVGGTLPGSPDEMTPFPNWLIVDYIRVFQEN